MRIVPLTEPAEPVLLPDIAWDAARQLGDIVVDAAAQDLKTSNPIETAVLICLMTDRRVDASELPDGESNRGWPGDGFDLVPGERPLGSKLWLLRRRALTNADGSDIAIEAQDHAREALQVLIDQGVAVRADVTATSLPESNRLDLDIALYGRSGEQIFQRRFAVLWDMIDGRE